MSFFIKRWLTTLGISCFLCLGSRGCAPLEIADVFGDLGTKSDFVLVHFFYVNLRCIWSEISFIYSTYLRATLSVVLLLQGETYLASCGLGRWYVRSYSNIQIFENGVSL